MQMSDVWNGFLSTLHPFAVVSTVQHRKKETKSERGADFGHNKQVFDSTVRP
jgi:hypothetical protein